MKVPTHENAGRDTSWCLALQSVSFSSLVQACAHNENSDLRKGPRHFAHGIVQPLRQHGHGVFSLLLFLLCLGMVGLALASRGDSRAESLRPRRARKLGPHVHFICAAASQSEQRDRARGWARRRRGPLSSTLQRDARARGSELSESAQRAGAAHGSSPALTIVGAHGLTVAAALVVKHSQVPARRGRAQRGGRRAQRKEDQPPRGRKRGGEERPHADGYAVPAVSERGV
jgi:hypothetical protein